jgi:murein DD-endopeptidase MepM/ murein hydrolase activator NlpD
MAGFWRRFRKEFERQLTILVVPHGTAKPRQLSFSLSFIAFLFVIWSGVTAWSGYMVAQRLDYWRLKANAHVMGIKLEYFANQMKHARETLDEVKEADLQLRTLIAMGSKDAIIQSEKNPAPKGAGGPSTAEIVALENLISHRRSDLSFNEISSQMGLLKTIMQERLASFRDISSRIDYERRLYRATPSVWPSKGVLTSHFGYRLSPFDGSDDWHKGVDIANTPGTPVRATADGTVLISGWAGGYGKVVVVSHDFGFSTRYGHNRQLLVKRGDRVKRGQIISLMGSTGNTTGPHCHYEVWKEGRAVNPRQYMQEEQ